MGTYKLQIGNVKSKEVFTDFKKAIKESYKIEHYMASKGFIITVRVINMSEYIREIQG